MSHIVRFGHFEADLDAGQLRKGSIRIKLRDQSFQVLTALLDRPQPASPGRITGSEKSTRRSCGWIARPLATTT
jgi:hypothetical protein